MILYIVLSIIIAAISFGCLRSKFESYVPVFVVSFIGAGVICVFVWTTRFYLNFQDHQIKTETTTLKAAKGFKVSEDTLFYSEGKNTYAFCQIDSVKEGKENKLVIVKSDRKYSGNHLLWDLGYNLEEKKYLTLDKKNYGIYKSLKDND